MKRVLSVVLVICTTSTSSGCASTYGNLVSGSKLGAQEYTPAVLVKPGMDGKYSEVLSICRQAAVNRQVTASQEAQLKTITGVTASSMEGAAFGMQFGSIMKDAGLDTSVTKSAGIGLAAGALSGLAGSFASGTEDAAEETKRTLLACLEAADPNATLYTVLE